MNEHSHSAIVDRDVWRRVQRIKSPRGTRPKSERLLARLGVLRCGSCGARLAVGTQTQNGRTYPFYRCNPTSDCTNRVTIGAEIAEQAVVAEVQRLLAGMTGTASADTGIDEARAEVERIDQELAAALRAFSGLDDVEAVRERLTALRDERDAAHDRLERLSATVLPAVTLTADDWDGLSFDGRRELIRAVIGSASVAPGRGRDRVTFEPRA